MNRETAAQAKPMQTRTSKHALRIVFKLTVILVYVAVWTWCIGYVYCLDDNLPSWLAHGLAMVITAAIPILFYRYRRSQPRVPATCLAAVFGCSLMTYCLLPPTHDREWGPTQMRLPYADVLPPDMGGTEFAMVQNIRANRYGPQATSRGIYYDDKYDLSKLKSVWFGIDRFTKVKPLAHSFLSFAFEPGTHRSNYLVFSVETRREANEMTFSPIRGIFRNYEIIYVISDEQDALSGRSDDRENVIQLYPIRATKEQVRAMFLDMLARANSIREQPEFYHTVTNNCTNNIVYHTKNVLEEPITAWQRGVVFPGYADWLAYRLGIIDTDLSLEEARKKFRIDQRVKKFDGTSDFSEFIRNN